MLLYELVWCDSCWNFRCGKTHAIKTTSYHMVNAIIHFSTTGMYTFSKISINLKMVLVAIFLVLLIVVYGGSVFFFFEFFLNLNSGSFWHIFISKLLRIHTHSSFLLFLIRGVSNPHGPICSAYEVSYYFDFTFY